MYLGLGLSAGTLGRAMAEADWHPPVFANSALMFGYAFPEWVKNWEGWTYVDAWSEKNARLQALLAARPDGATVFPMTVAAGDDMGRLLVEALAGAEILTRAAVKEAFERIKCLPATLGGAGDHPGLRPLGPRRPQRWLHPATAVGRWTLCRRDVGGFGSGLRCRFVPENEFGSMRLDPWVSLCTFSADFWPVSAASPRLCVIPPLSNLPTQVGRCHLDDLEPDLDESAGLIIRDSSPDPPTCSPNASLRPSSCVLNRTHRGSHREQTILSGSRTLTSRPVRAGA